MQFPVRISALFRGSGDSVRFSKQFMKGLEANQPHFYKGLFNPTDLQNLLTSIQVGLWIQTVGLRV